MNREKWVYLKQAKAAGYSHGSFPRFLMFRSDTELPHAVWWREGVVCSAKNHKAKYAVVDSFITNTAVSCSNAASCCSASYWIVTGKYWETPTVIAAAFVVVNLKVNTHPFPSQLVQSSDGSCS